MNRLTLFLDYNFPRSDAGGRRAEDQSPVVTMKTVRVLVADDHEVVLEGVRALIERQPDLEVCGLATTGREAVDLARKTKPDVVVLDMTMPELDGIEAIRQIRRALPNTEVVVFSAHPSEEMIEEVFEAGAKSYIEKTEASRDLVAAIRSLAEHKPFFTSQTSETLFEKFLVPGARKQPGGDRTEADRARKGNRPPPCAKQQQQRDGGNSWHKHSHRRNPSRHPHAQAWGPFGGGGRSLRHSPSHYRTIAIASAFQAGPFANFRLPLPERGAMIGHAPGMNAIQESTASNPRCAHAHGIHAEPRGHYSRLFAKPAKPDSKGPGG